ncbi:DUF1464 family protein [Dictyobacter arantiisoli]|uniref:Pilus assembly protein PilM n=1 Tax=Dictyobacter arantiisoli TaxID=2014874 RepID=A0A5A5THD6_9CHLR|nr:DUF1464 family protein [Dictyobacter arantiisoli]GCF10990.1 hypothetical protein KDI_45540 [Dictyobacter arantiisoli]
MAVSIGIDYASNTCMKICVAENTLPVEGRVFGDANALIAFVQQTASLHPELALAIMLILPQEPQVAFPQSLSDEELAALSVDASLLNVLTSLKTISQHIEILPAVKYLATIPVHRRLLRPSLGSARTLGITISLLATMQEQDASWHEMTFCLLELLDTGYRLVVVKEGQPVDGVGEWLLSLEPAAMLADALVEQALTEQLARELAGLMAIHHIEDVVLLDRCTQREDGRLLKDVMIDYFADLYQFFLYPQSKPELVGFEAASGAALLAGIANQSGRIRELAEHLFSSAQTQGLDQHR